MKSVDPLAPITCPDPDCGKPTFPGSNCEHCGCPLTEEAANDLIEGLNSLATDLIKEEKSLLRRARQHAKDKST